MHAVNCVISFLQKHISSEVTDSGRSLDIGYTAVSVKKGRGEREKRR